MRRVGDELLTAASAAEMVGMAGVLGAMRRGRRIDHHAAHRIAHALVLQLSVGGFGRRWLLGR